jgi:hypothetical protein
LLPVFPLRGHGFFHQRCAPQHVLQLDRFHHEPHPPFSRRGQRFTKIFFKPISSR